MAKPLLVLVNGAPGTGKTTLSRQLAKDLGLPCIGKDDIKELLYDHLGVKDEAWSRDEGAAAAEMLFTLIDTLVGRRWTLIAESAFFKEFAVPRIGALLKGNNMAFLEIYCQAEPGVRRQRYADRDLSGERHAGHIKHDAGKLSDLEVAERYAPLNIGQTIDFNTTTFSSEAYDSLLTEVKSFVDRHKKERR